MTDALTWAGKASREAVPSRTCWNEPFPDSLEPPAVSTVPAGQTPAFMLWARFFMQTLRITHAEYVPPGFHARFSATGKTYRYCISCAPILNPFDAGLAWHRPLAWSVDILEQAVHLFRGTHDFTAFAALRGNEPRPIPEGYFRRTITQTQVEQAGEHVFITFTGTGFLYKMVRLMTGAAHEAARGKITLEELARLINAPLPDDKSPFCAPPDGLTLMRVHYQEKTFGDKKKIN